MTENYLSAILDSDGDRLEEVRFPGTAKFRPERGAVQVLVGSAADRINILVRRGEMTVDGHYLKVTALRIPGGSKVAESVEDVTFMYIRSAEGKSYAGVSAGILSDSGMPMEVRRAFVKWVRDIGPDAEQVAAVVESKMSAKEV